VSSLAGRVYAGTSLGFAPEVMIEWGIALLASAIRQLSHAS